MLSTTTNNGDHLNSFPRTLFIDDVDVRSRVGLDRVVHPAQKYEGNPVLEADMPWEDQRVLLGGTVRKESGCLRMWYQGQIGGKGNRKAGTGLVNLYAESEDGINWHKPNLRQWEFEGNSDNNMYANMGARRAGFVGPMGGRWDHNQSVMYTPGLGEGRRYTMLSRTYGRGSFQYPGINVAFSGDGIDWTDGPDEPIISGYGDVAWFMHDDLADKFRGTLKTFLRIRGRKRRSVMYSVGNNLDTWDMPRPVFLQDDLDDVWADGNLDHFSQFYGMPLVRYESVVLGLLEVFQCYDGDKSTDGFIHVELACTRDGKRWERVGDRTPIIPRGSDGEWDWGIVQTGNSLLLDGDVVRVYYTGSRYRHGTKGRRDCETWQAIGMSTWLRDRMVGLKAGSPGGELSVQCVAKGTELHLNCDATNGEVVVELSDDQDIPISGFEISNSTVLKTDSLDHLITWGNNKQLSSLTDRKINVRLKMTNSEVFSIWQE